MLSYADEGSGEALASPPLEATLHVTQVPLLAGAAACVERGLLSTLHPQVQRQLLVYAYACMDMSACSHS